ncbi:carbon-nitrogen family hydrolase [Gorillibacterium sp. sgz5001074]|uniref:carbon-nitrogen family hydrolase n=1 Tax=Gorillibacterium sp. sgz5001074 TaxID=3446695 RepID=UPI003F672014
MEERKETLRLSLLQMDIRAGDPDTNYRRLEELLEETAVGPEKPDLVIFPELWNTGYALEEIGRLADPDGERTKAVIGAFCRRHGIMAAAGSIAEKTEEGVRNTLLFFNRMGEVTADYAKIHLFRLMDEEKALVPGNRTGLAELDGGVKAGALICYDIRFPELARSLALSGAKLLIVPAEWPKPRLHHWRTLLQARAIENQLYVAACNRVGASGGTEFFGHSMIIDPWGEVLAEGGEEEAVVTAEIRPALVDEVRSRIPVFEDRRPGLYRLE